MITIYLPTFAARSEDIKNVLYVLEKNVNLNRFNIGLEIGGKAKDFLNQEGIEKIVENISHVARGVKTTVHGFSGKEVYEINGKESHIADMSREEGRDLLETYIQLAKKIGSHYVHVHGGVGYQGVKVPGDMRIKLGEVRKNLLSGLENALKSNICIGIENLPSPSLCDYDTDSHKVWRDYVESIPSILGIVNGTGLKATFDTAHFALNKKDFDLIEGVSLLENHLYHLHACDIEGYWVPGKSLSKDGLIPGEGRIGEKRFRDFFRYIAESHPNIGIVAETRIADSKNPVEFRESVKKICEWLSYT